MTQQHYAYILIRIGGIQHFIFATGKLKEMIGASQIIYDITGDFFRSVAEEAKLRKVERPEAGEDWYVPIQANAGTLRLVTANQHVAACFLTLFSRHALTRYPGLPVYGVQSPFTWSPEGLCEARKQSREAVERQRAAMPISAGSPLIPFAEVAPLDGLPASTTEHQDTRPLRLSFPSAAKRCRAVIDAANKRLKAAFDEPLREFVPATREIDWPDDMEIMLAGMRRARLALIHIDANDLGTVFGREFGADRPDEAPHQAIARINALSSQVETIGKQSFAAGLRAAVERDKARHAAGAHYTVPLRPLVMGGDDLTVFVRADLAFVFIEAYVEKFEASSRACGRELTVGAGMVLMPASYPFVKAYSLVEQLLGSAKRATIRMQPRPSSLDFITLAGDVEQDLEAMRERLFTSDDSEHLRLTAKPYMLGTVDAGKHPTLRVCLENARQILHGLARSHTRNALSECRKGRLASAPAFDKLRENIGRELGGRHGRRRMTKEQFDTVFPEDGFFRTAANGSVYTALFDYLELSQYLEEDDHDSSL